MRFLLIVSCSHVRIHYFLRSGLPPSQAIPFVTVTLIMDSRRTTKACYLPILPPVLLNRTVRLSAHDVL